MPPTISRILQALEPSATLAMAAKAKELRGPAKRFSISASASPILLRRRIFAMPHIAAMRAGHTHYTAASGIAELKTAVAKDYSKRHGLTYAPEQVVISNGAKHSLHNVFTALCNPGDEVVIPAPYWVSYAELVKLTGAKPVIVETRQEDEFKLTPAQLRAALTPRSTILLLCSPSNPTGSVYTPEELAALADIVLERNLLVVSDEIYEQLIYGGHRFASFPTVRPGLQDRTVVVNGVSKAYAMTGWRIGWTLSPKNVAQAMADLQSQETSNPSSISQYAAVAAIEGPQECVEADARRICTAAGVCRRADSRNPRLELPGNGGGVLRLREYPQPFGTQLRRQAGREFGPMVLGAIGAAERGDGDGLGVRSGGLCADIVRHEHGKSARRLCPNRRLCSQRNRVVSQAFQPDGGQLPTSPRR